MESTATPPRELQPHLADFNDKGPAGWQAQLAATASSGPLAGFDPDALVWLREQDLVAKGVPIGHARYLLSQLFIPLGAHAPAEPFDFGVAVPACTLVSSPSEWIELSLDLVSYIASLD
eukprot:TRINITY_DN12913_c0_g1_i2.p2 TRINITY_DN12913_c0_g1~~TRINITY_DN12913_c0_g1_i2.p2  ORF type:complete len:119 (-),score=22.42 TRINITY_DN12913_c0_g1_i2:100-456(-)